MPDTPSSAPRTRVVDPPMVVPLAPARGGDPAGPFRVSTEGTSQVTILSLRGTPIARFYAGRCSVGMLDFIESRLNAAVEAEAVR